MGVMCRANQVARVFAVKKGHTHSTYFLSAHRVRVQRGVYACVSCAFVRLGCRTTLYGQTVVRKFLLWLIGLSSRVEVAVVMSSGGVNRQLIIRD